MRIIIPVIFIVLAFGIGYFFVMPEYNHIQALRLNALEYDDALSKATELDTLKQKLQAQYDSIDATNKTLLKSMIPDTLDTVALASDIAATGIKHNIVVKNISFTDESSSASRTDVIGGQKKGPYHTTSVTFGASGQYRDLVAFLQDLEVSVQLIDVTRMTISASTSKDTGTQLSFTISANTYSIN